MNDKKGWFPTEDNYDGIPKRITYEDYNSLNATLTLKRDNSNPEELRQGIEDFLGGYYTEVPENCYSLILPLEITLNMNPMLNGNLPIIEIKIKYNPITRDYTKKIIIGDLKKKFKRDIKSVEIKKN